LVSGYGHVLALLSVVIVQYCGTEGYNICVSVVFLANQACFTARLSLSSSFCRRITIPAHYPALSAGQQCRSDLRFSTFSLE